MADIEALGTLLGAFLLLGDVLRHCVKKEIESYVAFARGDLGYLHGSGYTPQPKYRSQPRLEPGASKRYLPGIEGKFQGVSEWRYQQKREETTRAHEQFDSHLRNLLSPLLHEEHAELLNMEEVIVDPWHAAWRVAHPGAALQELLAESEEPYAAMLARMVPFMTEVYAEARAEDPSFQKRLISGMQTQAQDARSTLMLKANVILRSGRRWCLTGHQFDRTILSYHDQFHTFNLALQQISKTLQPDTAKYWTAPQSPLYYLDLDPVLVSNDIVITISNHLKAKRKLEDSCAKVPEAKRSKRSDSEDVTKAETCLSSTVTPSSDFDSRGGTMSDHQFRILGDTLSKDIATQVFASVPGNVYTGVSAGGESRLHLGNVYNLTMTLNIPFMDPRSWTPRQTDCQMSTANESP